MMLFEESPRGIPDSSEIPGVPSALTALSGLAFQINLFYLHALCESAKAGKSAKGFSIAVWELGSLVCSCRDLARESEKLICECGRETYPRTAIVGALYMVIYDIERAAAVIGNVAGDSGEDYAAIRKIADSLSDAADCAKGLISPSGSRSDSDSLLRQAQALQNAVRELAVSP